MPTVMRRPPSSAAWVLYQNMQRAWRVAFIPATFVSGVGVMLYATAELGPSGEEWWVFGFVAVITGTVVAAVARASAPDLGTQD